MTTAGMTLYRRDQNSAPFGLSVKPVQTAVPSAPTAALAPAATSSIDSLLSSLPAGKKLGKHDRVQAAYLDILERNRAIFQNDYLPVAMNLLSTTNDMSIVDGAVRDTAGLQGRIEDNAAAERRGLGLGMSPVEEQEARRMASLSASATTADVVNNARVAQFDRNATARDAVVAFGKGVEDSARQGLNSSANNEANRNAAYERAKAQQKAGAIAGIGKLAGMAAAFATGGAGAALMAGMSQ